MAKDIMICETVLFLMENRITVGIRTPFCIILFLRYSLSLLLSSFHLDDDSIIEVDRVALL